MLKEKPGEINRKYKRMQASRDNLKETNQEKAQQNKKLRDRNVELTESRDMWKSRSLQLEKTLECQKEELKLQIEIANKTAEEERMRGEKGRERVGQLETELEEAKKKFMILQDRFQK